jgi:hypothetical protein
MMPVKCADVHWILSHTQEGVVVELITIARLRIVDVQSSTKSCNYPDFVAVLTVAY